MRNIPLCPACFLVALLVLASLVPLQAEEGREEWLELQKRIDRLIIQLASPDPATARTAVEQLVNIGDEAVYKLLPVLNNPNAQVRLYAVSALGKIGNPICLDRVRTLLKNESFPITIIAAAKALHNFGDSSGGEKIVPFVRHEMLEVRRFAIATLGTMRYQPALPVLLARITINKDAPDPQADLEKHPGAMCDIALALRHLGNVSGLPILSTLSRDTQPAIRLLAVQALTHFDEELALISLAIAITDTNEQISDIAYDHVFTATRRRKVIAVLQKAWLDPATDPGLKTLIEKALAELGGELPRPEQPQVVVPEPGPGEKVEEKSEAALLLEKLRSPTDEDRKAAAEGIVAMGPAAVPLLLEALPNESNEVKLRVIGLLALIKDPRALPAIWELLGYTEVKVRCRAAWALGEIPHKDSVPRLITSLADSDATAPFYVINSLAKLTGMRHGFEPRAGDDERAKAIAVWNDWWAANKDSFAPRQ